MARPCSGPRRGSRPSGLAAASPDLSETSSSWCTGVAVGAVSWARIEPASLRLQADSTTEPQGRPPPCFYPCLASGSPRTLSGGTGVTAVLGHRNQEPERSHWSLKCLRTAGCGA